MTNTTASQPRTKRHPSGVFIGTGAVGQHDGSLPLYICNGCQREVVWATSSKTGRKYLVNVSHSTRSDARFYIGRNVHDCEAFQADDRAHIELAANRDNLRKAIAEGRCTESLGLVPGTQLERICMEPGMSQSDRPEPFTLCADCLIDRIPAIRNLDR